MIHVNEKSFDWFKNMSVYDLFTVMGYKLKNPAVLLTVDDTIIRRSQWDVFHIPENAKITVLNLLRGG